MRSSKPISSSDRSAITGCFQPVWRYIRIASARDGLRSRAPLKISLAWDRLMLSGGAVRADGSGGVCIPRCSHITNICASGHVRTSGADSAQRFSYSANMARRGIPKTPPAWHLPEWMETCGIKTQTAMREKTGWSKASMSQLYNGTQDFNSKILREAADALGIEPHELLMSPERAMAARRLRQAAVQIVHDADEAEQSTGTHG